MQVNIKAGLEKKKVQANEFTYERHTWCENLEN